LSYASDIYLTRYGGIGDLCLLLSACKVIADTGMRVTINTDAKYHDLVRACPNVNDVVFRPGIGVNLNGAMFGVCGVHQTDAYLNYLYNNKFIEKPISIPELQLNYTRDEQNWCELDAEYIVLHPVKGDPNRTMDQDTWQAIANDFLNAGFSVVTIGRNRYELKNCKNITTVSLFDAIDVIANAKVLVSSDTGPIQLAGATETPIIGIYSVVKPEHRLPYRHDEMGWNCVGVTPSCRYYPCYSQIADEKYWECIVDKSASNVNKIFQEWCLNPNQYGCMKKINPQLITAAFSRLMENK
jgi:ADP-heptose:LPS heptosyltransferase